MDGSSSEVIERYLHGSDDPKGEARFEPASDKPCSITRLAVVEKDSRRPVEAIPFLTPFFH